MIIGLIVVTFIFVTSCRYLLSLRHLLFWLLLLVNLLPSFLRCHLWVFSPRLEDLRPFLGLVFWNLCFFGVFLFLLQWIFPWPWVCVAKKNQKKTQAISNKVIYGTTDKSVQYCHRPYPQGSSTRLLTIADFNDRVFCWAPISFGNVHVIYHSDTGNNGASITFPELLGLKNSRTKRVITGNHESGTCSNNRGTIYLGTWAAGRVAILDRKKIHCHLFHRTIRLATPHMCLV